MVMLVQEFLERSASRLPEKAALIIGKRILTYAEYDAQSNCLANALKDIGLKESDRVVIYLDNSIEAAISIFGTLKAGGIFVVINPTIKYDKLIYILNNCRASVLITQKNKWSIASKAAENAPNLKSIVAIGIQEKDINARSSIILWSELHNAYTSTKPPINTIDIDLAALIYTSGTTGNPKGVMMTHRNIISASSSIIAYLENCEDDIILNVLPLSFDYGLYQIIMAAQFGGKVIIEKAFLFPYEIIKTLKREKVTGFPIVPTISAILLQMEELRNERFEHLRYITNTAASLPVSHIRALQEIFQNVQIYSMYGLTECKRALYLPPAELDRRPTSVGIPIPNEHAYLVDENNQLIEEPHVVGELVVRGANVMKGYWDLPEETANMLRTGKYPWEKALYTGDLFKKDEDGFFYFISRKDDIIKSRGEKVSPKEIENELYSHPDIVEAAVVGVPDKILGEAIKAYVVLKQGSSLTEKSVIRYCMENLEDFMVPKIVEFRDSLPKTRSGKITKKNL